MTSPSDRPGYSLLEMAVVMAILALIGGLVLSQGRMRPAAAQMRSAAQSLAGGLREARAQAIGSGRVVVFQLDLPGHRFQVGTARAQSLPPELDLSMTTIARAADTDTAIGEILFAPDGSSTGGRIGLQLAGRRASLAINWLNGLVTVSDAN